MTPDQDQAWLDLLAGREAPGADDELAREATLLRDGLRRYRTDAPPGELPAPEERIQRLLERGHRAGILQRPEATPAPIARPAGSALAGWRGWPAALLGLGLTAGLATWWALPPRGGSELPPFVLRGEGVLQRQAADIGQAHAQRDALLARLRALNLEADAYEQLDRPGIDLVIPQPPSSPQRSGLAALGIPADGGPHLRIEFVPARP